MNSLKHLQRKEERIGTRLTEPSGPDMRTQMQQAHRFLSVRFEDFFEVDHVKKALKKQLTKAIPDIYLKWFKKC